MLGLGRGGRMMGNVGTVVRSRAHFFSPAQPLFQLLLLPGARLHMSAVSLTCNTLLGLSARKIPGWDLIDYQ